MCPRNSISYEDCTCPETAPRAKPLRVSEIAPRAENHNKRDLVLTLSPKLYMPFVHTLKALEIELARELCPPERLNILLRTCKDVRMRVEQIKPVRLVQAKRGTDVQTLKHGLEHILNSEVKNIETLDLRNISMGLKGMREIAGILPRCMVLSRLYLTRNNLGKGGSKILSNIIPFCKSLTHLDLRGNNIGCDGLHTLASVLGRCKSLTYLNLCSNQAYNIGWLSVELQNCPTLKHLDYSNNMIGNVGANKMAASLDQKASLTHLNLANCCFGDKGASSIAAALRHCTSLRHLNLSTNAIGNEGVEKLAEMLKHNTTLAELKLGNTWAGQRGRDAIKKMPDLKCKILLK